MMNMRLPTLPMILKSSLAIFKYLVLFLIIYLLINWLRQPIMPVKPNLQLKDYQGTPIDIAAISQESPVLVYFWEAGVMCAPSPHLKLINYTKMVILSSVSLSNQEITHNLVNIYKDINIILRLLMIPMDKYSPTGKDK